MTSNTTVFKTDGRCIVDAETTIEGIRHKVVNKYVKCNPSLNSRAWGVTEQVSFCPECFKQKTYIQTTIFDML